jgi:hypothetical protein
MYFSLLDTSVSMCVDVRRRCGAVVVWGGGRGGGACERLGRDTCAQRGPVVLWTRVGCTRVRVCVCVSVCEDCVW